MPILTIPNCEISFENKLTPEWEIIVTKRDHKGLSAAYGFAFDLIRAQICGGFSEEEVPQEGSRKKYLVGRWSEYSSFQMEFRKAEHIKITLSMFTPDDVRVTVSLVLPDDKYHKVDASFNVETGLCTSLGGSN